MMTNYYSAHLSADRLRRCYEIVAPRVRQYLEAEIAFVAERLSASDRILELGCGYGRVLKTLAPGVRTAAGIDTSYANLRSAREWLREVAGCQLAGMDAGMLGFADSVFDAVVCIQNGLSAFHVDRRQVITESIRVTRAGGHVLLSSYSAKFWAQRLDWFRMQAAEGLVGRIDEAATRDGVIVCEDGFRADTITPDEFLTLTDGLRIRDRRIEEVDESSVFCELTV